MPSNEVELNHVDMSWQAMGQSTRVDHMGDNQHVVNVVISDVTQQFNQERIRLKSSPECADELSDEYHYDHRLMQVQQFLQGNLREVGLEGYAGAVDEAMKYYYLDHYREVVKGTQRIRGPEWNRQQMLDLLSMSSEYARTVEGRLRLFSTTPYSGLPMRVRLWYMYALAKKIWRGSDPSGGKA